MTFSGKTTIPLILCGMVLHALSTLASVRYQFEAEQTNIEDALGPPHTNFEVEETRLVPFLHGTGLYFDGTPEHVVELRSGAEDELLALLNEGFIIQVDFQVDGEADDSFSDMVLAAMDGGGMVADRAWQLRIFRSTHSSSPGSLTLGLHTEESEGMAFINIRNDPGIEPGTNYRVTAEWDPNLGTRSIEVWNLDTGELHGTNTGSITGDSLVQPASEVGVTLGGNSAGTGLFRGIIGPISIISQEN